MQTANRLITAGLFTAAVMLVISPAAYAEPIPNPDPIPVPSVGESGGSGMCQSGEVMQDGNCVPAMTPVGGAPDPALPGPALTGTGEVTRTMTSYVDPLYTVPNINGDPCTGAWESTACYAMNMGDSTPEVAPRSTLSSSP